MQSDIGKTEWTRVARPWIPTVILVGRLASDPEPRYMPSGGPVAQLRLATNEGEEPQFHQLSAWGKQAEFAASYLKKGRLLYVEGRLHGPAQQRRTMDLDRRSDGRGRGGPAFAFGRLRDRWCHLTGNVRWHHRRRHQQCACEVAEPFMRNHPLRPPPSAAAPRRHGQEGSR